MQESSIGEKIRKYRLNKGLTQDALAAELHVSSQAVSKWENGQNTPDISLLLPLSRVLEISVNELLGGDRRQVFEQKRREAEELDEELALLVVYDALSEFPDDESFLYERADYEYKLATRVGAQKNRKDRYLSDAIFHCEKLVEKFPDNDNYKSLLASSYFSMGMKERALQVAYSIGCKEVLDHCVESFSTPDEKILIRQKRIQRLMSPLISQLSKYNTRGSIDSAYAIVDAIIGDDKALRCFYLWRLCLNDALWYLDNGNLDAYTSKLAEAYEYVKTLDSYAFGEISCNAKMFDRLSLSETQRSHCSVKKFLDEFLYEPRLSHPASLELRRRVVQDSLKCHMLHKHMWRDYYRFCRDYICEGDYYSNFSTGWHESEEEFNEKIRTIMNRPNGDLLLREIDKNDVERLISSGEMSGYVASVDGTFFAYCHSGSKESFKQINAPENYAPENAKVLSIVEILVADHFKGCGLVEKLLDYTLIQAKKNGFTHAEVYPLERMQEDKEYFKELLECYGQAGFTVVRDLSNEQDGKYYIMQKVL